MTPEQAREFVRAQARPYPSCGAPLIVGAESKHPPRWLQALRYYGGKVRILKAADAERELREGGHRLTQDGEAVPK